MQLSSETTATIKELAAQVRDASKPLEERRAALRYICRLRGEPDHSVAQIPKDDLGSVGAAMTGWPDGVNGLSFRDAIAAVKEGRERAAVETRR